MGQSNVLLKAKGLYSFPNRLSSVPEGALLVAKNLFINRDDIAESRRGYKIYGTAMGTGSTDTAHQLLNYKNRILRHYGAGPGTTLEYDSDGTGTFIPFEIQLTGDTHTNTTIDNIETTAELFVGMPVTGVDIPANTTISSIDSNTQITISNAATASTVGETLTFIFVISEVDEGLRIKNVEQNGNLYFTSSDGIKKISASSASDFTNQPIKNAGGIKALDLKADINNNPGFLIPQSVVGYRLVWGVTDNNGNLILGAPSQRVVIRNLDTVNSKTVDLTTTIPKGVTPEYFFQLYRTAVFADPSGDQDPGDEMGLVYEDNPSLTDITNGYVTFTDITPESFRGANLYTNADSGEGIAQANDRPPLAKDIATFKGYTFYANTSTLQRLDLSLLGISQFTSGVSSLTITDGATTNTYTFTYTDVTADTHNGTTTLDGIASTAGLTPGLSLSHADIPDGTYIVRIIDANSVEISQAATASNVATSVRFATEDATNKYVALSQFATPAQQVEETARSLVRIVNNQSLEIVNAFYLSGVDDVPGLLLFEARSLNQDPFYLNVDDDATTGIEFSPKLPLSGNSVISDNEVSPNRIYYSKLQQPEAVPLLNFIDVGPKDKVIHRILALRDSLFILKEEGVYRLSGLSAPFQVYPTDFSTSIIAPDSAVVLNNLIYMFSDQGVATVTDTGIAIISRPIEDKLIKFLTPQYSYFESATVGAAYESDRAYYLFTVTNPSDTFNTQCFRFNTFTQTWTILDISKRSAIVNSGDNKLYLGATDTNFIEQERKTFDRTDFADREYSFTLSSSSVNGEVITLPSLTNVEIYDVFVQTQYLTISQYNRLLTKLDNDSLLNPHDYVSSLTQSAGINLSTKLDDLISKIAADPGRTSVAGATAGATYTALSPVGASFSAQQTAFNSLIALLNNDAGVGYSNYRTSTGTVMYEFPVLDTNTQFIQITTNYSYPLIAGPMTLYKHIETELQFVPQTFGDPSMTKQVSEGTYIFEDSSFTSIDVAYSSDLSASFEDLTILGNGPGLFGSVIYGDGVFGGSGSSIPFRTYLPKQKQRCRYVNSRFKHFYAREIFSFYGISLYYNTVSQRGYR